MESTGQIDQLEKTVGADGKKRALKRKTATVETAEERDRKTCIELNRKVLDAEREKAQWLVDHPEQAEPRANPPSSIISECAALGAVPSAWSVDEFMEQASFLLSGLGMLLGEIAKSDFTRALQCIQEITAYLQTAIDEATDDDQPAERGR